MAASFSSTTAITGSVLPESGQTPPPCPAHGTPDRFVAPRASPWLPCPPPTFHLSPPPPEHRPHDALAAPSPAHGASPLQPSSVTTTDSGKSPIAPLCPCVPPCIPPPSPTSPRNFLSRSGRCTSRPSHHRPPQAAPPPPTDGHGTTVPFWPPPTRHARAASSLALLLPVLLSLCVCISLYVSMRVVACS